MDQQDLIERFYKLEAEVGALEVKVANIKILN